MKVFLGRMTVVMLALLTFPSLSSLPAVAPQTSLTAGARYSKWSATPYMSLSTYTQQQAIELALDFDLVIGQRYQFIHLIPQMKAANPRVAVIEYMNAAYSPKNRNFPESDYSHDALGNRILSTKYGNYLMDIINPAWIKWVDTQCSLAAPYDGCFLDQMGDHLLNGGYLTSLPINTQTGLVWTATEWMNAIIAEGKIIVADNPTATIVGNGLHDGRTYFDSAAPSSQIFDAVSTALAETWLRQANSSVLEFKKEKFWILDVNMIIDAASRGKRLLVSTKIWTPATKSQIGQWHKYSFATFLLGTQGNAFYEFLHSQSPSAFLNSYPRFKVQLGTPLGAFFKGADGLYHRDWQGGTVWVNPTPLPYVINITQTCTTLNGTLLTAPSTHSVAAETGDVCVY